MKRYTLLLFVVSILYSCNNEKVLAAASEREDNGTTKNNGKPDSLKEGCYTAIAGRDTAYMQLSYSGANNYGGALQYKRFEKDSNSGSFTATLQNNKLTGWYSFSSEGKTSIREVCFRLKNNGMEEGYGDVQMRSDTILYKYPTALQFDDKHPFIKVTCAD